MAQVNRKTAWSYKKFSELDVIAAGRAIKENQLYTRVSDWLEIMDPTKVEELFYEDGRAADLTVTERNNLYPL